MQEKRSPHVLPVGIRGYSTVYHFRCTPQIQLAIERHVSMFIVSSCTIIVTLRYTLNVNHVVEDKRREVNEVLSECGLFEHCYVSDPWESKTSPYQA